MRYINKLKKLSWIVIVWFISRIALIFIGWVANLRIPGGNPSQPWPMSKAPLIFTMWDRYDSQWYLAIAKYGYNIPYKSHYSPQAFFPLYPALISFIHKLTHVPYVVAGIFLSNIFFISSLFFLYDLVEKHFDSKIAKLTIIFTFLFPTSFFFSAIYTESLFLLGTVLAFWAADQDKWWIAGIGGAIAVLTRNLGITLLLPLAWIAVEKHGHKAWKNLFPLLLIPMAFSLWAIYLWHSTGDPLRFIHSESGWGRFLSPPWVGILTAIKKILTPIPSVKFPSGTYISAWSIQFSHVYSTIDVTAAILGIILPLVGKKYGQPWPWVIFALIGVLIPMSAPTLYSMTPLASMTRYILVLFPLMVALAQISKKHPSLEIALFVSLPLIQGLFFILFTTWNWIA
ncbi:mannosyltransferase family protein [Thermoanaerobacterium thermosaccharolyticum]|uniref:mannosyltransferase family protein n=1 Tax=Thermoanaerobacterium thermosaccharolyticum TaxID=1517 RepID=UPI003DA7B7C5